MIVAKGRYYLYRHIRCDTNDVFYVGYGTKKERKPNCVIDSYSRAFDKQLRSLAWKSIVAKTDYTIEIILESDNKDFIHIKEKEFINLYGRRDLNKGNLVNFSNGGDGNQGYKLSESHKELISQQHKGRVHSPETKKKISKKIKGLKRSPEVVEAMRQRALKQHHTGRPKTIYQFDIEGNFLKEWRCAVDACKELNLAHPSALTKAALSSKRTAYGFKWKYQK